MAKSAMRYCFNTSSRRISAIPHPEILQDRSCGQQEDQQMDATPWWATGAFWAGVVISAIVGFICNVGANLYHNRLVEFMDSRKLLFREKRRSKAMALNKTIEDLHLGRRDRYVYMLRMTMSITMSF